MTPSLPCPLNMIQPSPNPPSRVHIVKSGKMQTDQSRSCKTQTKVVKFSSAEARSRQHNLQTLGIDKDGTEIRHPSSSPSSSISSILSCALAKEPEGIWCIVASLANTRPDCLKERLHFNNSFSIQPRDDDAENTMCLSRREFSKLSCFLLFLYCMEKKVMVILEIFASSADVLGHY